MVGRDFAGYRIEAQIGQGGIGAVYRARDNKLGRDVALKLLRVDVVAPAQRPRFEREAKALATLSHPNVVTILDCGVSDDVPYLVMELLEGQSLSEALGSQSFPAARAQRVMRELTAALAYVHERGLVHRDLKPGNVFLQRQPGGGERVKLLDFGLAKFLESETDAEAHTLTRTGEVFGTPAYMPPEQWSGDRVDARADVYSAAVVCFEMIAGRRPFRGEGQDLLRAQLIEVPPFLHEACADRVASPELERVLHRALAKLPRERLPSAVELAAELDTLREPWFNEGKEATDERRSAAAATRGEVHLATAPTLVQPAAVGSTARRAGRHAHRPSLFGRLLRQAALLGAWTLSIASLVVIGVAATMIYLSRDPDHPEASEALKQAMPPLRDAVTNAKAAVSNAVSGAAKQVTDALPAKDDAASTDAPRADAKREPARNPWRKPTPRALRKLRTKIEAGQRGTDRMLADLRRYNREQPEDPRGHLLLARAFMNRNAWNEALTQYKLAFDRDESSRGDPRMLKDLLRAVTRESTSARASELIPVIYGPEALEEITLARTQTRDSDERLRLERLARVVAP
jgi:eukaryotic-like serine/threonine-protein kinase